MSSDIAARRVYRSPFGLVRCQRVRGDGVVEARPLHWTLATQQPPVFYLKASETRCGLKFMRYY